MTDSLIIQQELKLDKYRQAVMNHVPEAEDCYADK